MVDDSIQVLMARLIDGDIFHIISQLLTTKTQMELE